MARPEFHQWDDPFAADAAPQPAPQEVTMADWGRAIGSGFESLMSMANSGGRYVAGQMGNDLARDQFAADSQQWALDQQDTIDKMTPEARERLEASVSSPEFWSHPFSATALKALQMSPTIAATVLPAGLFSGGVMATMAVGGLGGAMSASDYLDNVYKEVDSKTDEELIKASGYYASHRLMGMSEDDARDDYLNTLIGMKPLVAFAIGAAANAVGPTGTLGRSLAGAGKKDTLSLGEKLALKSEQHPGIITRTGEGAAVGAASEIVDEGTTNVLSQKSKMEGGLQSEFDVGQFRDQALEGGLLGGVMGGAAHAITGGGRAPVRDSRKGVESPAPVAQVDAAGPDAAQAAALAANQQASQRAPAREPEAPTAPVQPEQSPAPAATAPTPADQARGLTQEIDNAAQAKSQTPAVDRDTVPEAPETIEKQIEQLLAGQRQAVMIPPNTRWPGNPKGMAAARIPGVGLFLFNPKVTNAGNIIKAAQSGRLNEILALGSFSKQDIAPRLAAGEQPVAVTERTPDGVEVKAAAGTDVTAPQQVSELEATKTPGNTVQVESPAAVVAGREAGQNAAKTPGDQAWAMLQEMDQAAKPATEAPAQAEALPVAERAKPKRMTTAEREAVTVELKKAEPAPVEEAKPFELTDEFQEVPKGTELPKGTMRKMQGGKLYARRLSDAERQVTPEGNKKPGLSLEEAEKMAGAKPAAPEPKTKAKPAPKAPKAQPVESAERVKRRAAAEAQIDRLGLNRENWTADHIMGLEDLAGRNLDDAQFTEDGEDAGPKRRHRSRAEIQKELDDGNNARMLFEDNVVNADIPGVPTTPEARRALAMRLETLLKMAENLGITIPKNVHARTADHLVYLREAADMLETLRNERAKPDRVNEHIGKFYPDEYAARTRGDFGGFRERRKTEGDLKSRPKAKDTTGKEGESLSTVENQADTRPNPEEALAAREDVTGEGNGGALTAEDIAKLPEEARLALLEKRAAEEQERLDRAREVVGANGEKAAPQPPNKPGAGKIVVEVKGTRKKWALAERSIGERAPEDAATRDPQKIYDDEYLGEASLQHAAGQSFWERMEGKFNAYHTQIAERVMKRAAELAPNVRVIVASDAFFERAFPGRDVGGFYNPDGDMIVLRQDAFNGQGKVSGRLLAHEALHAAFYKAIDTNPTLRMQLTALMDEVSAQSRYQNLYGFTNAHEFVSEAFTSAELQEHMMQTPAPAWAVKEYGLGEPRKLNTWEVLMHLARRFVAYFHERMGSMSKPEHTVLDAMMRVANRLEDETKAKGRTFTEAELNEPAGLQFGPRVEAAREQVRDRGFNLKGKLRRAGDYLSMGHQLAQRAAAFFSGSDAPRRVMEFREMMRVAKSKILDGGGHDFIREGAALDRKYQGTGHFERAAELAYEATINDVNLGVGADNTHLGKDAARGWQAKARLADMENRFAQLPADLRDWIQRGAKYFRDVQNEISLEQIKNILDVAGVHEDGLAERIFATGLNDADRAKFKTNTVIQNLDKARNLKKIHGMYFPLLREGEYVVTGHHPMETPKGGERVGRDTIQFVDPNGGNTAARRMAREYVEQAGLTHVGTEKVYVDVNDHTKILEKEDINAVPAYRVTMQTQHMELHDNEADARRAAQELRENGLEVEHVGLKAQNPQAQNGDMLASQLQQLISSLKRRKGFTRLSDTQKNELVQALNESSTRFLAGTRVQQRMLPRRKVAGYSTDLLRNSARYADMAAGYLAKLQYMPKVEAALGEMQTYIKEHGSDGDDKTIRRDELFREFENRIYRPDEVVPEAQTPAQTFTRRLLQISQLDKLAGVSFHLVNATEPWTTSVPVIGARHGMAAASRALTNAYRFIGAGDGVIAAMRDTIKAARSDTGFTDFLQMFKEGINADKSLTPDTKQRFAQLLDHLHLRGLLDNQSGLEVARTADPSAGRLSRGLDRVDLMARQMGQAVESINRAVTGLTAYHLEYKRTGDHQAALQYAHDVTADTMGNYSVTNSAPIFNTTLGRLTLQFKKFGQKTYYLLGKSVRGALAGDPEAAKQFAGLMFTHAMVAGALGLPIEPFKIAVMAANALGATAFTYDDFEDAMRRGLTNLTGSQKAAEAITRGVPRLAGVDLSGRLGLDNLLVFGQPMGNKKNDITAFLAQTVAGAPLGYVLDQIDASQALAKGDYAKAIELTVPIKAVTDAMRAGQGVTTGKLDANGREVMKPYSAGETALQAIGLTPSRKIEAQQFRGAVQRETNRQTSERRDFMNKWAGAKDANERAKVWGKVEQWNADRPREARLTRSQLDNYLKTRRDETRKGDFVDGVRVTNQNRYIYSKNKVFNID